MIPNEGKKKSKKLQGTIKKGFHKTIKYLDKTESNALNPNPAQEKTLKLSKISFEIDKSKKIKTRETHGEILEQNQPAQLKPIVTLADNPTLTATKYARKTPSENGEGETKTR